MANFYILSARSVLRTTEGSTWHLQLGGFEGGDEQERFLTAFPGFTLFSEDGELLKSYNHNYQDQREMVPPFTYITKILRWLSRNPGQVPQVSSSVYKRPNTGEVVYTWTVAV